MMAQTNDQLAWDTLFKNAPDAWKAAWTSFQPQPFMHECAKFFRESNAKKVHDVGCGVGIWSIFLTREGFEVLGTDYSPSAICFAKEWAERESLSTKFEVSSILDASSPETFDAVVAAQILDNLTRDDMATAIENIRTSLKSGGVLYAQFSPFLSPQQIDAAKAANHPTKDMTHVNYRDDELVAAFSNFREVRLQKFEPGLRALFMRK